MPHNNWVAIVDANTKSYPSLPPLGPPTCYPELSTPIQALANGPIYKAVRDLFRLLDLDAEHYGTPDWNPLGELIQPGQCVLIKPNFVLDYSYGGDSILGMVTHGAVIQPVLDYVGLALRGEGKIIIGDGPMHMADFQRIVETTGVGRVLDTLSNRRQSIELIDLRKEKVLIEKGIIVDRIKLPGDPKGYVYFNLAEHSALSGLAHEDHIRGADYDAEETLLHHHGGCHEYLISRSLLESDCIISMPKLKTHAKVGVTINLKNMIGVVGDKNWIPHYRLGPSGSGGDECPPTGTVGRFETYLRDVVKQKMYRENAHIRWVVQKILPLQRRIRNETGVGQVRNGTWHGNDTLWRSVLDVNRIVLFGRPDGQINQGLQHSYLSVVDGIVAGEGNGPVMPQERHCGVLLAGFDPVAVDICAARLMGFDYKKIPHLRWALRDSPWALSEFGAEDITCRSNVPDWREIPSTARGLILNFKPPDGWSGHMEWRD